MTDDRLRGFAHLIEGPAHQPHGEQVQVGWIGHRLGDFYCWDDPPMDEREPGGFSPCYLDRPGSDD